MQAILPDSRGCRLKSVVGQDAAVHQGGRAPHAGGAVGQRGISPRAAMPGSGIGLTGLHL
jgi:hypothetical protein